MEKEVIGYCPICKEKLIVTKLYCNKCNIELAGEFSLIGFSYLSEDELGFINSFLKNEGRIKDVQNELDMTYQKVKQQLSNILIKLGLKEKLSEEKEAKDYNYLTKITVNQEDHFVKRMIIEKFNEYNGKTTIPLINDSKSLEVWFANDGGGLESASVPKSQLCWDAFIAAYNIIIAQDGEAYKGYARAGKLGSEKLPIASVEGYIASDVHDVKPGESAFSPGFAITAILGWAGIVNNERGSTVKVVDSTTMVKSYEEALENARTFNNELGNSKNTINKLSLFRQWYFFEEIDSFAPSKFIGYRKMSMKAYEIASTVSLDGRNTENALKKIFDIADDNQKEELKRKLADYLSQYDKTPNNIADIHVKKSKY